MYIRNMVYRYKVTLPGLKGFFRVYLVNGENSLYKLHKQLQCDLEFPMDQPILFKASDEAGAVVARYALIDLGFGTVDSVKVKDTIKAGVTSFVYFYDIQARKSVIITLEGEAPEKVASPKLIESKGPVPLEFENGYVAFEDLPDDQRHLPSESDKAHKNKLASLLDAIGKDDADDEDAGGDDDEDIDDIDDDDEDEDEDDGDEDGVIIYDGSEELTI